MNTVLITGASSGIGRAAAHWLASHEWLVFACVRSDEDAAALNEVEPKIKPLIMDVTKPEQIEHAVHRVEQELNGDTLTGLVNNAGIAQMGPLALQPLDEFKAHFEVNVFGALSVTQAFLPLLGMDETRKGRPGRVVNITSVGGKLAAPFLGAYSSTKHAVEGLTDSLRRELLPFGIDVIAIGPGSVKTPIWDKAEEKNESTPYANTPWGKSIEKFSEVMLKGGRDGFPPEDIAAVIEEALTSKKPKARYAPVPDRLTNWTIPRRLPKRWVDRAMAKRYAIDVKG